MFGAVRRLVVLLVMVCRLPKPTPRRPCTTSFHIPLPSLEPDLNSAHTIFRLIYLHRSLMENNSHHVGAGIPHPVESQPSGSPGGFEPSARLVRLVRTLDIISNNPMRQCACREPELRSSQLGGFLPPRLRSRRGPASSVEGMLQYQKPIWIDQSWKSGVEL